MIERESFQQITSEKIDVNTFLWVVIYIYSISLFNIPRLEQSRRLARRIAMHAILVDALGEAAQRIRCIRTHRHIRDAHRMRGRERESRSNEGPAAPGLWASSRVFAPRLAPTAAHRFLSGAPHALHSSPHLLLFLHPLHFLSSSRRCSLSLSIRAGVDRLTIGMLRLQSVDAEYFRLL